MPVKPPVTFKLMVGDTDYTRYVTDISLTWPWNGMARMDVTFENHSTTVKKFQRITPSTFGFRHHRRPTVGAPLTPDSAGTTVRLSLTSLGVTSSNLPVFIPGGWQGDEPLKGVWPVYDFTYLLSVDNQYMGDIVESSPPTTAVQLANSIASRFGIASTDFRFLDHRIRQLRMNRGRPRTFLQRCGIVSQACMRFRGSTLVMEPYIPGGANSTVWSFKTGHNVKSFEWRESEPPPANQFSITRLDPMQGVIGRAKCTGTSCPGRTINMTLNPPSPYVTVKYTAEGRIHSWVFVDENGVDHTGTDGVYTGPTPAVTLKATYEPPFLSTTGTSSIGGYTPSYELIAYGANRTEGFAADYQRVFDDPASQAQYGVWPASFDIEDAIIPDAAVMAIYGQSVLRESVRKTFSAKLTTPYVNPLIEPGHWVNLDAPLHGPDRWGPGLWFIETVRFNLVGGSWGMGLDLTKGLG